MKMYLPAFFRIQKHVKTAAFLSRRKDVPGMQVTMTCKSGQSNKEDMFLLNR